MLGITESKYNSQEKINGISTAVNHADDVIPDWSDRALAALKVYLRTHDEFQCENFRAYAENVLDLPQPPNTRAYGGVMIRAKNKGLIKANGARPTTNKKAHNTMTTVWVKL